MQLLVIAAVVVIVVASLVWVAVDARNRGRSPFVMVVLCALTWPLGFLFWRIVRPPAPVGA